MNHHDHLGQVNCQSPELEINTVKLCIKYVEQTKKAGLPKTLNASKSRFKTLVFAVAFYFIIFIIIYFIISSLYCNLYSRIL